MNYMASIHFEHHPRRSRSLLLDVRIDQSHCQNHLLTGTAQPYNHGNNLINTGYPVLSENVRPIFTPKYPSFQYTEDDYIQKSPPRSQYLQHSKDYHQMLNYSATPIDPFYDAPNVISNVGRRRANAIHLVNSPERVSHSQGMARIYQKAQETIRYQDEVANRLAIRERPVLSTSTPKRRPQPVDDFRSDSKVPTLRYDATVIHRKPLPRPPIQCTLPEYEPLSRLSDDIPRELRTKSSIPRPLRVRRTPSSKQFVPRPLKLSKMPSPVIRSPRRRAGNGSIDSGICMPPTLKRQDAICGLGDAEVDYDGFELTQHISTPRPCAQPFEDLVAKRVATWLESVDGSPPPSTTQSTDLAVDDSPMEAFYKLQAQSPDHLDAGIQTPSSKASSHEIRDRHASTISKLVCIPPLRIRFPSSSSSRLGVETLATPPRRFKIPARGVTQADGLRHTSNSSKSRVPTTANAADLEQASGELDDSDLPLPSLSPDVELYRKGKGPKMRRQQSYWDDDLLMPGRPGEQDDEGTAEHR